MSKTTSVLIVGRSKEGIDTLENWLAGQPGLQVSARRVENGHTDPLHGVASTPDVLVLYLSELWEDELRALSMRHGLCPPIVAIGDAASTQMMRMAMQAGARDFFGRQNSPEELIASIRTIVQSDNKSRGATIAVVNGKGGAGGSFIACSVAHIIAVHERQSVCLVDMDLQFGSLPIYFNLEPHGGLLHVLETVDHLDALALEAYMIKHVSGLHLLSTDPQQIATPWTIPSRNVEKLLDVAAHRYAHIVVDLPRQIDPITTTVFQRAEKILLVTQQSVTHLHDTKRLLKILRGEFAVPNDRVHLVVNRFQEKNPIKIDDIRNALNPGSITTVPNDFKRVAEIINVGSQLFDNGRNAPITKAFLELIETLVGSTDETRRRPLKNVFSNLLRR